MSNSNIVSQLYAKSATLDQMKKEIRVAGAILVSCCEEVNFEEFCISVPVDRPLDRPLSYMTWWVDSKLDYDLYRYRLTCSIGNHCDGGSSLGKIVFVEHYPKRFCKEPEVEYVYAVHKSLGGLIRGMCQKYPEIEQKLEVFLDA